MSALLDNPASLLRTGQGAKPALMGSLQITGCVRRRPHRREGLHSRMRKVPPSWIASDLDAFSSWISQNRAGIDLSQGVGQGLVDILNKPRADVVPGAAETWENEISWIEFTNHATAHHVPMEDWEARAEERAFLDLFE